MIDPLLDGYAIGILELHNVRRRALALLQQRACSMVTHADAFTTSDEDVQAMANLVAVIATEPIQPLSYETIRNLAMLARDADAQ